MDASTKCWSILIVGLNRSGTKWLSNLVSEHPDVYSVQHPAHFGILESNVFNDFSRMFPSLDTVEALTAFVSIWKETDFVRISGVEPWDLFNSRKPSTVFDAFRALMDEAASRRDASCWLQKCSPIQLAEHYPHFSDSKLVFIKRKFQDQFVSAMENSGTSGRLFDQLRLAVNFCLQNQVLEDMIRKTRGHCISYEALKADPQSTMSEVFAYLGMTEVSTVDGKSFQPNTSFSDDQQKPRLRLATRIGVGVLRPVLSILPNGFSFWLWRRLRGNAAPFLIRGTFRVFGEGQNV